MIRRTLLSALLALTACSGPKRTATPAMPALDGPVAVRTTPDEAFRAAAPGLLGAFKFVPPPIVERRLKNGVRVLFVERHTLPVLSIRVVSDRGADQADSGIGELWSRMVLKSSTEHKWWDVVDGLNELGLEWHVRAHPDASEVHVEVLSKLADPAIDWLGELLCKPTFTRKFLLLAKQRLESELRTVQSQADGQMGLLLHHTFYPDGHPYHWPWVAPENIDKIDTPLVEAYHRYAFTPAHVTIAVAGDITLEALLPMLESAFGGLAGPTIGPQAPPPSPPALADDSRFVVVDAPQETQAHVAFSWLGPPRYQDGFVALGLAIEDLEDAILHKLRREKSLTYGVHAFGSLGRAPRPISFEGALDLDAVGEAVADVAAIVQARETKALTATELDAFAHATPGGFERLDGTSAALARIAIYARPLDWYAKTDERLAAVTPEDVRQAMAKHLSFARMRVLVVGPAQKVAPQLEKLGIGKVVVRKRIVALP